MKINTYKSYNQDWCIIYKRELPPGVLEYLKLTIPTTSELLAQLRDVLFIDFEEHWMYAKEWDRGLKEHLEIIGVELVEKKFFQAIHNERGAFTYSEALNEY